MMLPYNFINYTIMWGYAENGINIIASTISIVISALVEVGVGASWAEAFKSSTRSFEPLKH